MRMFRGMRLGSSARPAGFCFGWGLSRFAHAKPRPGQCVRVCFVFFFRFCPAPGRRLTTASFVSFELQQAAV